MGNRHNKPIPQYKEALHRFHGRELHDLKKTWKKLSHYSHGNTVDRVTFQEHFLEVKNSDYHLPKSLADHLFNAFDERHEDRIDYQEFIIGTAMCCKGTIEEKLEFCFHVIADPQGEEEARVNKEDLYNLFSTVVSSVHSLLGGHDEEEESESLHALVDCAFSDAEGFLHWEEFKNWATSNSIVLEYLEILVHKGWAPKLKPIPISLPSPPPPPPKFMLENNEHPSTLISPDMALKLRESLQDQYLDFDFSLLYSAEVHGYGLGNLYNRVSTSFPLILVMKDEKGNIFGAFCPEPLKLLSSFHGNRSNFLFTLSPRFEKYDPPLFGGNHSFVMCTPHSLTFGGPQAGLSLDRDIDKGQTFSCPTYGSPPLTDEDFSCVAMEVWNLKFRELPKSLPNSPTPVLHRTNRGSAPSSPLGSSEDLRKMEELAKGRSQLEMEQRELKAQLESIQKELEKEKRLREELEGKIHLSPPRKRKTKKEKKHKKAKDSEEPKDSEQKETLSE